MIKKCSMRWCRYFSRFGFNFANLPLLGSCTLIALKHLMVVSSMWPIGPLVESETCSFDLHCYANIVVMESSALRQKLH